MRLELHHIQIVEKGETRQATREELSRKNVTLAYCHSSGVVFADNDGWWFNESSKDHIASPFSNLQAAVAELFP